MVRGEFVRGRTRLGDLRGLEREQRLRAVPDPAGRAEEAAPHRVALFRPSNRAPEIIVRPAQIGSDGPTGGFVNADDAVPW